MLLHYSSEMHLITLYRNALESRRSVVSLKSCRSGSPACFCHPVDVCTLLPPWIASEFALITFSISTHYKCLDTQILYSPLQFSLTDLASSKVVLFQRILPIVFRLAITNPQVLVRFCYRLFQSRGVLPVC